MLKEHDTPSVRLRMIAKVLHIPVERFYDEAPEASRAYTVEMQHLWNILRTDRGRAAALNALRKALDDKRGEKICHSD